MNAFLSNIKRLLSILASGNLAQLEHSMPNPWGRLALRNLRIIIHVGRALVLGKHSERAAALTYFSLVGLVPLLAVIFSLFKAFGGLERVEEQVKTYILGYLANSSQSQVSEWLDRFVSNFHAGAIGGVGTAALLVTLLFTLTTIEEALNQIWGLRVQRGWGRRFVVYWTLLTVGPMLLGTSLAMTASLQSSRVVLWAHDHIPLFALYQRLVPIMFTSLAFSAMYLILPAARVRWTAALTGGIVAGVIFEVVKLGYAVYATRAVANNPLYGSLAALPFFIIWINYSWRVVLFGADVAHAIQYLSTDPTEETDPRTNQATREEAAVRICAAIARAFAEGTPPPTTVQLSMRLLLPAHLTEILCQHLLAAGLLREVVGGRRRVGFVPARPLADLSVADVVRVLRNDVGVAHWAMSVDTADAIDKLLAAVESSTMERFAAVRWSQLAENGGPIPHATEAMPNLANPANPANLVIEP